ncbi:hypothetical protein CTRI78_v000943 [Colletotrichum trifolii]|uniref:Secreted protein n=1 Tax=Colletotrichum trifolii TaxID=5466 RepID=A0A4R8RQL5_COLTR|nr:hypothetical protein CTRI78_v000943 [Colletotrichum trifolii]
MKPVILAALAAAMAAAPAPAFAAGTCCTDSLRAGNIFDVCVAWAVQCKNPKECVAETRRDNPQAWGWCTFCFDDVGADGRCTEDPPAAGDALSFPDARPPRKLPKRGGAPPGFGDVLVRVEQRRGGEEELARRADPESVPFTIPARYTRGSAIDEFDVGDVRFTVVTSARGNIQIGINNKSRKKIKWLVENHAPTRPDFESDELGIGKKHYFRWEASAQPGDPCVALVTLVD